MDKPVVGGQALIEGVMFLSPSKLSFAVRKPDGSIHVEAKEHISFVRKYHLHTIPIIRGMISFFDMLVTGTRIMNKSAQIALGEEEKKEDSLWSSILLGFSFVLSIALAIGLFKFLPLGSVTLLRPMFSALDYPILFTLTEGMIKLTIFILYIYIISLFPDVRRVFQYHGAEHKVIRAFEADKKLTIKNIQESSRYHPRCGTSFVIIVIIISILVYSIIPLSYPFLTKLGIRILFLPLLAGIGYEVLRLLAWLYGKTSWLIWVLPGYAVQALTTREPDDEQVEVALKSFEANIK